MSRDKGGHTSLIAWIPSRIKGAGCWHVSNWDFPLWVVLHWPVVLVQWVNCSESNEALSWTVRFAPKKKIPAGIWSRIQGARSPQTSRRLRFFTSEIWKGVTLRDVSHLHHVIAMAAKWHEVETVSSRSTHLTIGRVTCEYQEHDWEKSGWWILLLPLKFREERRQCDSLWRDRPCPNLCFWAHAIRLDLLVQPCS